MVTVVTDVLNQEVAVGDQVLCIPRGYRELVRATIISVTAKTAIVEYPFGNMGYNRSYRLDWKGFVKIPIGNDFVYPPGD